MDFKKLKQQRNKIRESMDKLREANEQKKGSDSYMLKIDKDGNGQAIVRILPQKDVTKHPVVTYYKHQAKQGSKFFSVLCPSTFGTTQDCELCQELSEQWVAEKESGVEIPKIEGYRSKKRIVSVLVIEDKDQPEFEGTVQKMYIPSTLEDKINKALFPPKAEDGTLKKQPKMIHDLWEGHNLHIEVCKNSKGYNDYTESYFDVEPTPVAKKESDIEHIYNQLEDLLPSQERCLSSAEVKAKFETFTGLKSGTLEEETNAKRKANAKQKEEAKAKEQELEEEFSNNVVEEDMEEEEDVEEAVDSSDDEELPWD